MSTPSKLGILQSEAGHNAQSDIGYAVTLALTGVFMVKLNLRKQPKYEQDIS
jgi:hypothetical protein